MALRTNPQLIRCRSGITLVELMFAGGAFVIVLGTVLSLCLTSLRSYDRNSGINQTSGAGRLAAEHIKRDLRNADSIVHSHSGHTTDAGAIVLRAPSYDADGVIAGSHDYIVYRTGGNTLLRDTYPAAGSSRPAESGRALVRNVDTLQFSYLAHDFFDGDGSATSFVLNAEWLDTPVCRIDGALLTDGVTYSLTNRTAYIAGAPPGGSVVEFAYTVDPATTGALAAVSEVGMDVTSVGSCTAMGANARLRNKH